MRRRDQRAKERSRQAERSDDVDVERFFERLVLRIGEEREGDEAEARGVVDQNVDAAEHPGGLQRDPVDVVFSADVADDAVRAGGAGGALHRRGSTGDEGDVGAARGQGLHQRKA